MGIFHENPQPAGRVFSSLPLSENEHRIDKYFATFYIYSIDFGLRTMAFAIAAAIGFFILQSVRLLRTSVYARYRALNE